MAHLTFKLTVCILTICLLNVGRSFILLSSAAVTGGQVELKLFDEGNVYSIDTTVLLTDINSSGKDVGYKISGLLEVDPVWKDNEGSVLLKFEVRQPKLHIKSRKAPSPEGFIEHTSSLDKTRNEPFFVVWNKGVVEKIFFDRKEEISTINYKKSLASLFQFQILDIERDETDVSGNCNVVYRSASAHSIKKTKHNCSSPDTVHREHLNKALSAITTSSRETSYILADNFKSIHDIKTVEEYKFTVAIKRDAGSKIQVLQELKQQSRKTENPLKVKGSTVADALQNVGSKYGNIFQEENLHIKNIHLDCVGTECASLAKLIKDNRDNLKADKLGTVKSATTFLRLLNGFRNAKTEDIVKIMKGVKNKEILQQLLDLMGYAQTHAAHLAAKKFLNFDSEYDTDNVERYLWALSVGTHPDEKTLKDIFHMVQNNKHSEKIDQTLLLTAASMASRQNPDNKIFDAVKNHILKSLSACQDDDCHLKFLRALKNLRHPSTVDALLEQARKGKRRITVMAMSALKELPKNNYNEKVLQTCKNIFYQIEKKYDSSARVQALDILLESDQSADLLRDIVFYLASNDKDYEVKQYVLQKLLMISNKCPIFRRQLSQILRHEPQVNNWNILGQRGLSTALSRGVSSNPWSNVSLVSVQEISSGVLKKGRVDVLLEAEGETTQLFSLGLYAGGLSSMMGGSEEGEGESEEAEEATAGMELTLQGAHVRPFTFFTGQGELMGHVWSGTASDRTTAFQALTLLQDHTSVLALGSGSLASLSLLGAASLDLAGEIQLSLWNRNAHSQQENNAGIAIQGIMKADTPFVKSQVEFVLSLEPKLKLVSDIDFYNDISLCIQVEQPDTLLKHTISKWERIPGSAHSLRISQSRSLKVPGHTYALNRKNTQMCNNIHSK